MQPLNFHLVLLNILYERQRIVVLLVQQGERLIHTLKLFTFVKILSK